MNQHGVQRLPGNGDAKSAHAGEVRQADPTRHVLPAEYNLLLGTMTRLPVTDATFQSSPDTWIQIGGALQQFFEQTDRTNPRMGLQHRDHIGFKKTTQRVWLSPPPQSFLLGRKPGSCLIRYPVARLKPAFAAATSVVLDFSCIMKNLIWLSAL